MTGRPSSAEGDNNKRPGRRFNVRDRRSMDNHANNQHPHIPRSRTSMDNVQPTSASQRNRITVAVRVLPLNAREVKNRRVPIVRVSKHGVDPLVQISRLAKRGACLKSEMSAHWEYGFD